MCPFFCMCVNGCVCAHAHTHTDFGSNLRDSCAPRIFIRTCFGFLGMAPFGGKA